MAESSTLARPYAKAAFDYAHSHDVVAKWEDFLFVASTIITDDGYKALLNNPSIHGQSKADVLSDLFDEQVSTDDDTPLKSMLMAHKASQGDAVIDYTITKVSPAIKNFLQQLASNERLALLPSVYQQFCTLRAKASKQVEAEVTTAYPLSAEQKSLLKDRLEASLATQVMLKETVDTTLIAGAKIKIGDKVVDDSVAGKLKQLKVKLMSA